MVIYLVVEKSLFTFKIVCGFLSREDALNFIKKQISSALVTYSLMITELYV